MKENDNKKLSSLKRTLKLMPYDKWHDFSDSDTEYIKYLFEYYDMYMFEVNDEFNKIRKINFNAYSKL